MATNKRAAKGTGNLRKRTKERDGKAPYTYWEGTVTVGYDPGTGKQKRRTFTGKTQKEVREKMQAAAVAVQDGDFIEPSRLTVGEWFNIWFKTYCGDKKYLTLKQYKSMVDTHIRPALGAVKLQKLTDHQIQSFINELMVSGRTVKRKDPDTGKIITSKEPLSAKTVKNIYAIFNEALSRAVRNELINKNPASMVTLPRVEKKEMHPLTDPQIKAFMDACSGHEFERLYKLILFTGLREGEALGLTWDRVDFDAGTLRIAKQLQKRPKRDGGYTLAELKNGKERTIKVSPFVLQLLKEQQIAQAEQRLAAGEAWQGWQSLEERKTGFVFTRASGRYLDCTMVYKAFKKLAEEIGAAESRVHDLRHTYATVSLQSGVDPLTVSRNLGHATVAFTLEVYGHVTASMRDDAAGKIQAYIENMA